MWWTTIAWAADADVARGWYLWRTGRDDEAAKLASEAVALAPQSLAASELEAAMAVLVGEGATLEAARREQWTDAPSDLGRRIALAQVVTLRHAEAGGWCDEVSALLAPAAADDGEGRYFAALIDRQRELRCTKQTSHADAELRRIANEGGELGRAEGVLAKLDAGYVKIDLPDQLEQVWADEPWRVERAGVLWAERVTGPGRAAARRVANKALSAAAESDDPVVVHSAMVGYVKAGDEKGAAKAHARLAEIDAAADRSLIRSVEELHDPSPYPEIEDCTALDIAAAVACIDGLSLPETGAATAFARTEQWVLLGALQRPDDAYASLRAGWRAQPTNRHASRLYARAALERGVELEDARSAVTTALADRPARAATLSDAAKAQLVKDLETRAALHRRLGAPAEAVADLVLAQQVAPLPSRELVIAVARADAALASGDAVAKDESALRLAYALARAPTSDTARISEGRDLLAKLAWLPVQAMVEAAAREPGEEGGHAILGKKVTAAELLPTPVDPKKPGVRIVALYGESWPGTAEGMERVRGVVKKYAERGVSAVLLDIDVPEPKPPEAPPTTPAPPPAPAPEPVEPLPPEVRQPGPSAMRALLSAAVPTVLVVDAKGVVTAAISPWDPGSLALEEALDALLP